MTIMIAVGPNQPQMRTGVLSRE